MTHIYIPSKYILYMDPYILLLLFELFLNLFCFCFRNFNLTKNKGLLFANVLLRSLLLFPIDVAVAVAIVDTAKDITACDIIAIVATAAAKNMTSCVISQQIF